ncbi:MAG: Putative peptidase M38 family protein [Candidatus Tokpelaia hoelldobleri]|uniref:Peptidase M38 family protein n=1 Tax=Candidatus Tokpelaia hoelldobleri TaxID=1902579 RepID=A0A1U9JVK0_9HYPH|nr:MAG: Putative peptidase M38 family protein [Candidatus Tokpelaia hoelldoblerii]
MFDHIFTNAIDGNGDPLTIAVKNGRFAALGAENIAVEGVEITDLKGHLVLPGFVDSHIHLDKSFVGDRWHPHRSVSSLRERLQVEKEELAAAPSIASRAEALLRKAQSFGTIAMRSHVDVDATTKLDNLHAIQEVREKWRGMIDVQLVAFPQAGLMSCPGTADILDAALAEGVEVIGGIDPTTLDGDADGQLDVVFGLAEKHGVMVDIHLHQPGQLCVDDLTRIAARTTALGMQGKVTVSHAYGLGDLSAAELKKIADILAKADVGIMTNGPGSHPFPPVWELHKAGVRVLSGNDNIQDSWWPYGNGDMLQRAMIIGYRLGLNEDEQLHLLLDMVTHAGARTLGLKDYGLTVGNEADFIVVEALNAAAAVAAVPYARAVVRGGRVTVKPADMAF